MGDGTLLLEALHRFRIFDSDDPESLLGVCLDVGEEFLFARLFLSEDGDGVKPVYTESRLEDGVILASG